MPQTETIGKLAEITIGYQHRLSDEQAEDGEFLLIQQKNVFANRSNADFTNALRITPQRQHEKQILREGDVLFMNRGHLPFGCAVHNIPGPSLASGVFFILRPDTARILPEFLSVILNRETIRNELFIAAGIGAAMPVIHRRALMDQGIPLPDLEIQKKIIELNQLMAEEEGLMHQIAAMKKELIRGVTNQLISRSTEDTQ